MSPEKWGIRLNKLRALHDKVKYHKYRENIVLHSGSYKRYVNAFEALLNEFQREITTAKKIDPAAMDKGQKMLVALDSHGFLTNARHKLSGLDHIGGIYHASGSHEAEQHIRIIMAQLEGTLSSIHEYMVCGMVGFFLCYPNDTDMKVIRYKWRNTDYFGQP